MELQSRATEQFAQHMETVAMAAPGLSEQLAAAAERLVRTFVQGGKVLCSGTGAGALLARHFADLMLHCFERDRLALPAMTLSNVDFGYEQEASGNALPRQLAALGRPGDVLLLVSSGAGDELQQAIAAAHERELSVVALTGHQQEEQTRRTLLDQDDIVLSVQSENHARVLEVQLTTLHILCDLIDTQLLGSP
ncbi:MAG: SIS domain-containing protein [Gammaproteobacteria bacterium]|nr:MAG: SIS domain-containing protein [Gammaproteobacteria bacterium]